MKTNPKLLAVVITGVVAAMVCGFFLGRTGQQSTSNEQSELQAKYLAMRESLPLRLQAESASGGKTISMATGSVITGEVEGLFILDHLAGTLQCWLLNPRDGSVGGIYVADVNAALELDKGDADFVMVTGQFFVRGSSNPKPANTVCYVGDGKSGKVVGFGLAYNKQAIQNGGVQKGDLKVVCSGPIRKPGAIRE